MNQNPDVVAVHIGTNPLQSDQTAKNIAMGVNVLASGLKRNDNTICYQE